LINIYEHIYSYVNMNPNETPVINDAEQRREELARGLNNFASREEEETASTPAGTPTPKNKPKKKFASMAAASSPTPGQSAGTMTTTSQPAPAAPQALPGLAAAAANMAAPSGQTHLVSGRIVGAGANEPVWSQEELQHLASLRSVRLDVVVANDSRKAIPDPEGKYVVRNQDGTCSATMNAILPYLQLSEFKLGIGIPKPDERLPKKKMYSDVVAVGKNNDWVLNQWLSQDVIMEPVPASVRNRMTTGRGRTSDRTIGVHFARFGFPAKSFAPIFHTLDSSMKGLVDSLVMTDGYYWANASWGVTQTPGTFVYKTEQGTHASTNVLSDAMDMIGTKSSKGVGTFAISVACAYEKQGDQIVANSTKYEFSIKCHAFVHLETTDWHGPPQTSAIGVMVSNDFMSAAKPLSKPKAVSTVMNTTSTLFGSGGGNMNPFAGMNVRQTANEGEKQGPAGFL
jgi:hypothetical protein